MSIQYYSVEQVAELLGLHVRTVRSYAREGRLRATRIGKQYRIAREDLEAFMGGSSAAPAPAGGPGSGPGPGTGSAPVAAAVASAGGAAAGGAARRRRTEASTIVEIDGIDRESVTRLVNLLMAVATGRPQDGSRLTIQTVRDDERERLKVVVLGDLADTAELLRMIDGLVGGQS